MLRKRKEIPRLKDHEDLHEGMKELAITFPMMNIQVHYSIEGKKYENLISFNSTKISSVLHCPGDNVRGLNKTDSRIRGLLSTETCTGIVFTGRSKVGFCACTISADVFKIGNSTSSVRYKNKEYTFSTANVDGSHLTLTGTSPVLQSVPEEELFQASTLYCSELHAQEELDKITRIVLHTLTKYREPHTE